LVWDPHPLGTPPVPNTSLATPSEDEARANGCRIGSLADAANAAGELCARWGIAGVAVTLGARGAVLGIPGRAPYVSPAPHRSDGDACGAGDRFATATVAALLDGALLPEAITKAVLRATRYVAEGGVQTLKHPPPDGAGPPRSSVRHGVVVATSGCFDLLHAGHVASLEAARALGDHLVVLLNSDVSVRRLKGPGRPVVGEGDRAAVLLGLACVDEVVSFDQPTPVRALEEIRPAIFAKGGDYGANAIPEEAAMRRWGGEVVIVPYLEGRSTSILMEEVRRDR
jgi:rfaE bifunctional protein nucleotidyltransferase chain/domain